MASIPATVDDLDDRPAQGARFAPLHRAFDSVTRLRSLERDFADYVYRESALELDYHPALKLTARPDETSSQFRRRCYALIQRKRDQELSKLERGVQAKVERLEARIRREERELEQDELEFRDRKREELISAGESVFNVLRGRRHSRALSIASRKRRLTRQSKAEIKESLDAIEDLDAQIGNLLDQAEREQAHIQQRWAELTDDVETIQIRPRKTDVFVETWGVVWLPYWELIYEERGEIKRLSLAAFGGTHGS
jgi:chromosome segregation ATPase